MAKKLSRRNFLKAAAATTGGTLVGLSSPALVFAKPPAQEDVTLEVRSTNPEYENAERQIWDIFEAENPGVKIELFSVNEDQWGTHDAKVAGGWLPDIELVVHKKDVNRDNYANFVDLSTIDFQWFDRWQWDVRNTWPEMFQISGPRALDFYQGIAVGFIYHKDIIDDMGGWNPQQDIKTLDDLDKFLTDLNSYVAENPDVDFGWDRGWINGFMWLRYMNLVPVAYPDGGRDRQADCWWGRAKFNAEDSPFRHTLEYTKEMHDKGYTPDAWWNREWETDQEASFNSKKSAMVLHGPWAWDKALASNPGVQLEGFPFPSMDGEETLVHQAAPGFVYGFCLYEGSREKPYWDQILTAYNWWFSPPVVRMRAEVEGRLPLYDLDEPLELTGPQFVGFLNHVGTTWENVKMDNGPWAETETIPYRKGGSPGPWDRAGGGLNSAFVDYLQGNVTVQDVLDQSQTNWEASFEMGADGKFVFPE